MLKTIWRFCTVCPSVKYSALKCSRIISYHSDSDNHPTNRYTLTVKDLTPVDKEEEWFETDIKKVSDIEHKLRLSRYGRRHDVSFYLRLILRAAREGNLEKMLSVLFHDMLINDRVLPTRFIVNILLQRLGELGGHSEAALKIFTKSKEIGIQPSMVTYSVLFKNIAKELAATDVYYSIHHKNVILLDPEEVLKFKKPATVAFKIWNNLRERKEYLNLPATNSLLLALSRGGLMKESFMVLDEHLNNGGIVDNFTLSAVLEACLHDRKSGFGLAICLFNRLVYKHRCSISNHVLTILLKIAANCQFGNTEVIQTVLSLSEVECKPFTTLYLNSKEEKYEQSNQSQSHSIEVPSIELSYVDVIRVASDKVGIVVSDFLSENSTKNKSVVYVYKSPINMLQKKIFNTLDPRWLERKLSPSDKLSCIGGILGVISLLKAKNVDPNINLLTSLIRCLPYERVTTETYGTSTDFFNVVMKTLAKFFKLPEDNAFKNALLKRHITKSSNVECLVTDFTNADPYTWSSLAKQCKTPSEVLKFFRLMKENDFIPSKDVLFSLFYSTFGWNSRLIVLNMMKQTDGIVPDRSLIVHIESEIGKMRKRIQQLDEKERNSSLMVLDFYKFQKVYSRWLDKFQIDSITTGDKKILLDSLPPKYKTRD